MNREELKESLEAMSESEFRDFVKEFGGTHKNPESIISSYISNRELEPRLCQLLGLDTEDEKLVQAAVDSARSAKISSIIAAISALIAFGSIVLNFLTR